MMETVNKNEHIREPGTGGSPVQVIFIEDHSGVSFLKFSVRKDGFPPVPGSLMCSFLFTVSIMVFAYFICAVLLYGDVFRYVKVFLRYLGGLIRVFRGFYMDLTLV